MAKKEEYKRKNEEYLLKIKSEENVKELHGGVLYKEIQKGEGDKSPTPTSVVTVHYRGTLINGREFDNSLKRHCPEAFRVNSLINGFQTALTNMHIGDKWIVYIPWSEGYGKRSDGVIPAYSTLIFEIELLGIS